MIEQYLPELTRRAQFLMKDDTEADDLVQDTYETALILLAGGAQVDNYKYWMHGLLKLQWKGRWAGLSGNSFRARLRHHAGEEALSKIPVQPSAEHVVELKQVWYNVSMLQEKWQMYLYREAIGDTGSRQEPNYGAKVKFARRNLMELMAL